jgi:drug/metabolite transporter (DMT)-like permease
VQPRSEGFNAWALLCVLASFLNATRDVLTRTIAKGVPVLVITLSTSISVTLLAGGWSLVQPWQPVTWRPLALLAVAAAILSAGNFLIAAAMRQGEMSVIAPFRYAGLIVALALGYFLWGDVPNAVAAAGIVLLVGAGLALLRGQPRVIAVKDR